MRKAVFLDRDGVLNHSIVRNGKPYPPASLHELTLSDDVLPSLQKLKQHDFLLIGATNQPDVARGKTSKDTVEAINQHLLALLPLDEIRVCYHDDNDQCTCRKPAAGLLIMAAKDHNLNLMNCYMIGDRWKDIEAGRQAGCKTIWINLGYNEKPPPTPADCTTGTLSGAAEWILRDMT